MDKKPFKFTGQFYCLIPFIPNQKQWNEKHHHPWLFIQSWWLFAAQLSIHVTRVYSLLTPNCWFYSNFSVSHIFLIFPREENQAWVQLDLLFFPSFLDASFWALLKPTGSEMASKSLSSSQNLQKWGPNAVSNRPKNSAKCFSPENAKISEITHLYFLSLHFHWTFHFIKFKSGLSGEKWLSLLLLPNSSEHIHICKWAAVHFTFPHRVQWLQSQKLQQLLRRPLR